MRKLMRLGGIGLPDLDVIELNEAFAAQAIAVLRDLDIDPLADPRVNRNGGAIAPGHPLGMSGARLTLTAVEELHHTGGRYALAFMCVGVEQGIGLLLGSRLNQSQNASAVARATPERKLAASLS